MPSFRPSPHILVFVVLLLAGCDAGGGDPGPGTNPGRAQIIGSYDLVSIRDVSGEITSQEDRTLFAGVPNPVTVDFGNGQSVTVTFIVVGSVVFSSTAYTFDIRIETQVDGSSETATETATGTWTLQGSEMVLDDSTEPVDEIVSWSLVQGRLTLSNAETVLVFQRR